MFGNLRIDEGLELIRQGYILVAIMLFQSAGRRDARAVLVSSMTISLAIFAKPI